MCLTIPKKVIAIDKGKITVESYDGDKQEMKSIVELEIGDYVVSQQNVIIEKMNKKNAEELIKIFKQ